MSTTITTTATKSSASGNRHLVAVPYPGRGHINPMLNLCRLIASKSPSLLITFIVTEEWHGFLTDGSEPKPPANLRFGVIPQVVPSAVDRAAEFPTFVEAVFTKMAAPVEELIDRLEPPPTAMVYDTYLFWAPSMGTRRNITVAGMSAGSASLLNVFSHFDLLVQNGHFPLQISERGSEMVDYIPGLQPTSISDLPTIFHGDGAQIIQSVLQFVPVIPTIQHLLLTSLPALEGTAIDALKHKFPTTNVLPIGPLIPYFNLLNPPTHHHLPNSNYLQWLDNQPNGSVLYISMGSYLSTSSAQTDEIIAGVVGSGVRYLWVTRGDDSRFVGAGESGCLVNWCDQLRVLSHAAVGGFLTHCGWNSMSEAMFAGVPVLTWPVFWDQTLNGKMAADEWGIGRRGKGVGGEGLVGREEVMRVVREFMDPDGDGRREAVAGAERVRGIYRGAVASGGGAACCLDAFVREIS